MEQGEDGKVRNAPSGDDAIASSARNAGARNKFQLCALTSAGETMEAKMPLLVYMPLILYSACLEMWLSGGVPPARKIEPE